MLRWELEHGPHLAYSLAQLQNGENPPPETYTRPRMLPAAEWIWEAWQDLRRVCENGTEPSEWVAWCDMHEVDAELAQTGWRCVRALDSVWMRHRKEERERKRAERGGD